MPPDRETTRRREEKAGRGSIEAGSRRLEVGEGADGRALRRMREEEGELIVAIRSDELKARRRGD